VQRNFARKTSFFGKAILYELTTFRLPRFPRTATLSRLGPFGLDLAKAPLVCCRLRAGVGEPAFARYATSSAGNFVLQGEIEIEINLIL